MSNNFIINFQNQIVLIDKPKGITSFDVIRRLRKQLNIKKMGHAGTLDPLATGLMIIGIGEGTKQLAQFLKLDKEYETVIEFGKTSDTYDADGKMTVVSFTSRPSTSVLNQALQSFVGEITQTPPRFSAKKIKGVAAYKLARAGKTFVLPPRKITLYSIELIDYTWPLITIRVRCSSGTYVRSLAHDLGQVLGCGAYVKDLRRTKIGDWCLSDAKTLNP